jgi:dTDP-4-amino-4,6-dideoxygalactose transaminase
MIPVFNLSRQYESIKAEIDFVVSKVLKKGFFTLGEEVAAFEHEFAAYLGIGHAVGVGSGTDALTLVLKALGIGLGDEVILPANAYPSAFGVALTGVRIRLVDILGDGCMDPGKVARAVTNKTKAVIPVHLYGNPAEIGKIKTELLRRTRRKIYVIEDAAQAHGTLLGGKKAGTLGEAAIFSFYPSKNLGAYGDGGMIVSDDYKLDKKVRMLRQYGEKKRYQSEVISGVSRLDELQAAILRVKLRYLDGWVKRRREIGVYYLRELKNLDFRFTGLPEQTISDSNTALLRKSDTVTKIYDLRKHQASYHLFVVRTKKRDQLKKYLEKEGIGTGIHYPIPVHLTHSFRKLGYKKGNFPEAERQAKEALSLPMYPELTDYEVERVITAIKKFFQKL